MADDINPQFRAELEAAKAALEPQIRGLHDLTRVSISGDLVQAINYQIEIRERRQGIIQKILNLLDQTVEARTALERDGYPNVPESELPDYLFSELSSEDRDIDAAIAVFKPDSAQNISVNLGNPVNKPKEQSRG